MKINKKFLGFHIPKRWQIFEAFYYIDHFIKHIPLFSEECSMDISITVIRMLLFVCYWNLHTCILHTFFHVCPFLFKLPPPAQLFLKNLETKVFRSFLSTYCSERPYKIDFSPNWISLFSVTIFNFWIQLMHSSLKDFPSSKINFWPFLNLQKRIFFV